MYFFFFSYSLPPLIQPRRRKRRRLSSKNLLMKWTSLQRRQKHWQSQNPLNLTSLEWRRKRRSRYGRYTWGWTGQSLMFIRIRKMNCGCTFIHSAKFQVDLDSTIADLADGEDTQGAFHLLLIKTVLLLTTSAISNSLRFRWSSCRGTRGRHWAWRWPYIPLGRNWPGL